MLVEEFHYLVSIEASIVADVYGPYQLDVALNHYKDRLTPGQLVSILNVDTGGLMLLEVQEWRGEWED